MNLVDYTAWKFLHTLSLKSFPILDGRTRLEIEDRGRLNPKEPVFKGKATQCPKLRPPIELFNFQLSNKEAADRIAISSF